MPIAKKQVALFDRQLFERQQIFEHRDSIVQNPVKAGLVNGAEECPYCYTYRARKKAQGLNRLRKKVE